MKLLFISFVMGTGFELVLYGSIFAGRGCVPDGIALFAVAAHYPGVWLANHNVPFPLTLIVAIVLAVLVWSGIFYSIIWSFKKLFGKHGNTA